MPGHMFQLKLQGLCRVGWHFVVDGGRTRQTAVKNSPLAKVFRDAGGEFHQ